MILCEHPEDAAQNLVALAQRISAEVSAGMTTDKATLAVTVSIGITTATADEDADELIRQADGAMYVAKQRGPGNHHIWDAHP